MKLKVYHSSKKYKEHVKSYHDKKIVKGVSKQASMCFFSSRLKLFPGKLNSKLSNPFVVKEIKPYGAIEIEDPTSKRRWTINEQ